MSDASGAIRWALAQLGKPYVYGSTGPNSFDCSGLVMEAYRHGTGITIPRTTQAMLADPALQPVNVNQLKPGDLIFPSTEHVQMYLGGGKIVEAPRTGLNVRVSSLGHVYAARRVTNPASGTFGGSTASPVAATTPYDSAAVESVAAQAVGAGLTGAVGSILKPVFNYLWYGFEILVGFALVIGGVTIIVKGSVKLS